jgi:hypothetical protein
VRCRRFQSMRDNPKILKWPLRKFEEFARSNEWRGLPFAIQLAMVHVWRAEQDAARMNAQPRSKR